jgi:hypothetical protein
MNGSFVGFPQFFKTKYQFERSEKFAYYPAAFLFLYIGGFLIHFTAVTVIINLLKPTGYAMHQPV